MVLVNTKRLAQVTFLTSKDEILTKYQLASDIKPEIVGFYSLRKLLIAGVKIHLFYRGHQIDKVSSFLNFYYKDFKSFEGDSDVNVYYDRLQGKWGESGFEPWNNWTHELEFIKGDNSFDLLIQRDFVAKVAVDGQSFYARGPEWSLGTCDSIDNLVSYALGRKLISYRGFILHAACIVDCDQALIFFGASGVGKSTIAEFSHRRYGAKVISSDQVIVQLQEGKWVAQVMPTTIPEFPLQHPAREIKAIPIKAMLHLVQNPIVDFEARELDQVTWIKYFMRELVYRPEFSYADQLLELSLLLTQDSSIIKGEMSYAKESSFLEKLHDFIGVVDAKHESYNK